MMGPRIPGGDLFVSVYRDLNRRTHLLKRAGKPVKQIAFEGERFDVMSVRRWRDRVLPQGS